MGGAGRRQRENKKKISTNLFCLHLHKINSYLFQTLGRVESRSIQMRMENGTVAGPKERKEENGKEGNKESFKTNKGMIK